MQKLFRRRRTPSSANASKSQTPKQPRLTARTHRMRRLPNRMRNLLRFAHRHDSEPKSQRPKVIVRFSKRNVTKNSQGLQKKSSRPKKSPNSAFKSPLKPPPSELDAKLLAKQTPSSRATKPKPRVCDKSSKRRPTATRNSLRVAQIRHTLPRHCYLSRSCPNSYANKCARSATSRSTRSRYGTVAAAAAAKAAAQRATFSQGSSGRCRKSTNLPSKQGLTCRRCWDRSSRL